MTENLKCQKYKIHGMHCASCEVLVERKFKEITGIEKVNANFHNQTAEVYFTQEPSTSELTRKISEFGYSAHKIHPQNKTNLPVRDWKKDLSETGLVFMVIMSAYLFLSAFGLLPKGLAISSNMSYGFIFLIGLVAAVSSCLAVTGGLLLAISAKFDEAHPDYSAKQKFIPHLYFNAGRIISYTVFGGLVGLAGSALKVSTSFNAWLTIFASAVMVILGFQLLQLFSFLGRFQPRMPKFLAHKIHNLTESTHHFAPFTLGAATFFLPCGFTQALQVYVLSKGSWQVGALTMLAFSLGTLPALLSISAISSFIKGTFQRIFIKFAGVIVLLLGLGNINNGLSLLDRGINFDAFASLPAPTTTQSQEALPIVNGKQFAKMKITGVSYYPSQFVVKKGVPVDWQIDGTGAAGCAGFIVARKIGLTQILSNSQPTVISFTPQEVGDIAFSCPMGMTTRGAKFIVTN